MIQIQMQGVTSKNVRRYGYDAASMTLRVEFNNGQRFDYAAVPASLVTEFEAAESKGGFLHARIVRGGFACRKLEPAPRVEERTAEHVGSES